MLSVFYFFSANVCIYSQYIDRFKQLETLYEDVVVGEALISTYKIYILIFPNNTSCEFVIDIEGYKVLSEEI